MVSICPDLLRLAWGKRVHDLVKGDGETHPALSPSDEFADYWRWDKGNVGLYGKKPDMLPREYARAALQRGLAYEAQFGDNPFKFGMIGSTDSHTSLATTREESFSARRYLSSRSREYPHRGLGRL